MPFSSSVGSKLLSQPFVTDAVAVWIVVELVSPTGRYSRVQVARVELLAVPTTSVGPVRTVPSVGVAMASTGGSPDGVGVIVGVVVAVAVGVSVSVGVG